MTGSISQTYLMLLLRVSQGKVFYDEIAFGNTELRRLGVQLIRFVSFSNEPDGWQCIFTK